MSRLRELREERDLTLKQVADLINTSEVSVSRYERFDEKLTLPLLRKFSSLYNCSIAAIAGESTGTEVAIADDSFTVGSDEYVLIPGYDAAVSAGPGSMIEETAEPLYHNAFRLEWLRGLTMTSSNFLAMLKVVGDSMEPTLRHGDFVLVDRSNEEFGHDGLYVLESHGVLQVKRVHRSQSSGLVTIISDNKVYPPEENQNPDEFRVRGRVLWLSRNVG